MSDQEVQVAVLYLVPPSGGGSCPLCGTDHPLGFVKPELRRGAINKRHDSCQNGFARSNLCLTRCRPDLEVVFADKSVFKICGHLGDGPSRAVYLQDRGGSP
jgi:hypothetical protein